MPPATSSRNSNAGKKGNISGESRQRKKHISRKNFDIKTPKDDSNIEESLKFIEKTTENTENNIEIVKIKENKSKKKYKKKNSDDEFIVKDKKTRGRPKKSTVSRNTSKLTLKAKNLKKSALITFNGSFMKRKDFQMMFTLFTAKFAADWEERYLKPIPILSYVLPLIETYSYFNENQSNLSNEAELLKYLPENTMLTNISVHSIVSNQTSEIGVLNLFESRNITFKMNSSFIINVGGPVWGLDWCPFTNYLVVSTHTNLEQTNSFSDVKENTCGAFQVYELDKKKNQVYFRFIMCHQFAPVLFLKFCPHNQIVADQASRVGLMTFCGCDHTVRIISFPNPNNITNHIKIDKPNILLKPYDENEILDTPITYYRALSFEWHPRYPHNRIVVGYSDGHFSIFEIPNNAIPDPQIVCYPITEFHISSSPLSAIKWYPHDENIICAGNSNNILLFSLSERRTPLINIEKWDHFPLFDFPYSSNSLILFSDMRIPRPNVIVQLEFCRYKNERISRNPDTIFSDRQIIINTGTIKDLHSCPKTGFTSACDDLGKVYLINYNERFLKSRGDTIFNSVVYSISSIYSIDDTTDPKKKLTVIFEDSNEIEKAIWQMSKIKPPKRENGSKTNILHNCDKIIAVNRVAFNTTPGSLCWLASGGNLGLVRIHCVSRWTENILQHFDSLD